jgi:hypothetical protein
MNRTLAMTLFVTTLVLSACAKTPKPVEHAGTSTARIEGEPALCDPAHPGVASGSVDAGGTGAGDAVRTGTITLARQGDCRRVTLALFGADGGVARASGHATASFDRASGLVRIPLPARIAEVTQADTALSDASVAAVYVVHGLQKRFFLDVHLARPVLAAAHALDDPARLFLDLAPGGSALPGPAARAKNVVVIEPRAGVASYPLVIRGYARTFEANVVAVAYPEIDTVATTVHATAADWATTWGEFEMTIPKGAPGRIRLFVGEYSAKDGTPIGVMIPLEMR